jgi:predicted GNAT family acetyltransferase
LHGIFKPGRLVLYATPHHIPRPKGWRLLQKVRGVQMIFNTMLPPFKLEAVPVPLGPVHVPRMVELAHLTRPGPFSDRTIEFGHYYGIFQNDKLVSMTGQRLHINNYTEVSAVCTHPDFPGRGFAGILVKHLVNIIRKNGQVPFLHVRADNEIAIRLYQKLGFSVCRPMNFYFLMRTRRLAL